MPATINTFQPGLGLTQYILRSGIFPPRTENGTGLDGSAGGGFIASIHTFAGNYTPNGNSAVSGSIFPIAQNTALFSLLGTNYGGNGTTNFAIPDLRADLTIGSGQGAGLASYAVGQQAGQDAITLTQAQLPVGAGGSASPVSDLQPSTAITYAIAVSGIFPSDGSGGGPEAIGSILAFAGNFAPAGYLAAQGQLLSISDYSTLFTLIGTTYGGDGQTNFRLPDLRGRTMIGASATAPIGTILGGETDVITSANMPANMGGGGQPVSTLQPSLAVNYLIALTGIFPSQIGNGGQDEATPFVGEILASIASAVPRGYMRCEGQLLPIAQNQALFSVLGTTYGGNGMTNFALPDLRGRSVIDAGTDPVSGRTVLLGQQVGSETYTITSANIPDLNFSGTAASDTLYGGDGNDAINGLSGNDTIAGNGGNDTLDGLGGDDQLSGMSGADLLRGGVGNDSIIGDTGVDTLDGGTGIDTLSGGDDGDYYYVDAADVIVEAAGVAGGYDYVISSVNYTLPDNVEQLVLQGGATAGTGGSTSNYLYGGLSGLSLNLSGGGGDDVLYSGLAGGNTLSGGDGVDTLLIYGGNNYANGGLGSDIYYTYTATDTLSEAGGDGIDTVYANWNFTMGAGFEQLVLFGAANTAVGSADANIIYGNGTSGAVTLFGLAGADVLFGGAFNDALDGGSENDYLFGLGGVNTLTGGAGNDIFYVETLGNTVIEMAGGGLDTLYSSAAGITTLAANVEQLILYGASTGGIGSSGSDSIYGNASGNALSIEGGDGFDYILGSNQNDTISGGLGNDTLDLRGAGAAGNDSLFYKQVANFGSDTVIGFDADPAGGQDLIDVLGMGYGAVSFGNTIIIGASGGDTLVTFQGGNLFGTIIRLQGVAAATVTSADFVF
jgi:microcystin-dependent protein